MSGGSLGCFYSSMQEHDRDFGDKELDELVSDLAGLFKDREWFLSSDTCAGDWNESRDEFKKKWFTEHGRQERIEKYLAEFSEEIRQTFGIGRRYCKTCKHWQGRENPVYDGKYGRCPFCSGFLMHRSESCEKWEEPDGGMSFKTSDFAKWAIEEYTRENGEKPDRNHDADETVDIFCSAVDQITQRVPDGCVEASIDRETERLVIDFSGENIGSGHLEVENVFKKDDRVHIYEKCAREDVDE